MKEQAATALFLKCKSPAATCRLAAAPLYAEMALCIIQLCMPWPPAAAEDIKDVLLSAIEFVIPAPHAMLSSQDGLVSWRDAP